MRSGRKRRENLAGGQKRTNVRWWLSSLFVLDQPSCKISYDIRLVYWVSAALEYGWSGALNAVGSGNQRTLIQFTSDLSDPSQ